MAREKQQKSEEDTLKRLIGLHSSELTAGIMVNYNVNTLQVSKNECGRYSQRNMQVILNDLREKIEQHNTELVTLLMQKDELENERDSILMDMEDIPHSSLM